MNRSRFIGLLISALVAAVGFVVFTNATPAQAYTIENRSVTHVTNGLTGTMYYELKVQSGNDQFRPNKFVLSGVPSGTTYAYVYAASISNSYEWLAVTIDSCTGGKCVWAVTPTTWAPIEGLGVTPFMTISMSGGISGTWALSPSSGTLDPGGRPVVANLTQDFVKQLR